MAKAKKANKSTSKKASKKKSGIVKSKTVSKGIKIKKSLVQKPKKKPAVTKQTKKSLTKSVIKKASVRQPIKKIKKLDTGKAKVKGKSIAKKEVKSALNKIKKLEKVLKNIVAAKKGTGKAIPIKELKGKAKSVAVSTKSKIDVEDKLHSKAQRIMKELEETMDMEKVKPRIKVPTFIAPKPRIAPAVIKLIEPENTKKEKYQLEFEFRSSKAILFSYLSDSSGMAEWFADEVKSSDNNYTFVWEGSEVHAKLVAVKDQLLVRFQWTDEHDGTYFQFEIKEDDITSDIALLITDWANPGEKEASARLWESQVQNLRQLIGSV